MIDLTAVLEPGDVMAVRTGDSFADKMIRLGAALRGRPNLDNHIVIVHHLDKANTLWGIEGRPGGVGWVDVSRYNNPYLLANTAQPKTAEQREAVCKYAVGLLGTPYDWDAIIADAMQSIGAGLLWRTRSWQEADGPPAHVVCASLAAYAYHKVGLTEPTDIRWSRFVTPGDWCRFIIEKEWEKEL